MPVIQVNNSFSRVLDITPLEFKRLRKELSYTEATAAFYTKSFPRIKYLIDKQATFPTGLLERVQALIPSHTLDDQRKRPSGPAKALKIELDREPYAWQRTVEALVEKHHRGGIQAVTGSGKSLVIGLIANKLRVRTLVVVPSLEIKNQLQQQIKEWFGQNEYIRVENIDSKKLQSATNFECLIVDECHHSASRTYQKLNKTAWKDIYYRYFLTGTFYRNQDHEQLLFEGIAGRLIYKLTYREAVKSGYIVPVDAFYVNLPKMKTAAYTYREVYDELIVNNSERNSIIAEMMASLRHKSTLCLVKEIKHGMILSALTGIPFANGQDEESRAYIHEFNAGDLKHLIGTTGVLGEGVDTKPAEYIVIAGLGKAKSAFCQQIGRGVRKYPGKESAKIILFRDRSHKFLLRHYNEQAKILLEEYGIKPEEL